MKERLVVSGLCLIFALALMPGDSSAQSWPDSLDLQFDFEGFGNMVTMSPPVYSGDITDGSSEVNGGTWQVSVDDTGWPATSDPETRWNYIFDNYFTYIGYGWLGEFDGTNLPEKPNWNIDHPTNGSMEGTLTLSVIYPDANMNGVLEISERTSGEFSGTMMVMKYGTGYFSKYCGDGSYNGTLENSDPANFVDDFVYGHCNMNLIDCQIDTEASSWSVIKSYFK